MRWGRRPESLIPRSCCRAATACPLSAVALTTSTQVWCVDMTLTWSATGARALTASLVEVVPNTPTLSTASPSSTSADTASTVSSTTRARGTYSWIQAKAC
jgi:hypothetical protein